VPEKDVHDKVLLDVLDLEAKDDDEVEKKRKARREEKKEYK